MVSLLVERFSRIPVQIECPEMRILGFSDWDPPIFAGAGTIRLETPTSFRFLMHAQARDPGDALRRLSEAERSPFEVEHAFRLVAIDYDGIEWNCGWMHPRIAAVARQGPGLLLDGNVHGMSAVVARAQTARGSDVELVFNPAPRVPLGESLVTTARIGDEEVGWRVDAGRHRCSVLGSAIEMTRDPWSENLRLVATASERLPHPYLENWLSEPLRVLCGQLTYPRLVARDFDEGRALVFVRPSPSLRSHVGGLATMIGPNDPVAFWSFYERYLAYVAQCRGADGHPNFESNPVTRFHEEVIQASRGSRWMLALALASGVEGLCKLAAAPESLPREFSSGELTSAHDRIAEIESGDIQRLLTSYLGHLGRPSVRAYLSGLVDQSVITGGHLEAWERVRNRVVHGELGDPWPDESSEERLKLLLELFYSLTVRVTDSSLVT